MPPQSPTRLPVGPLSKNQTCPMCEYLTLERRLCKSVCAQCGYVESCEDNFIPNQSHPAEP